MLELDGLTRRYGELVALDDLSFTVAPGRPLGFVGSNGAILQAANQRVRVAAALRDAGLDDAQAARALSPPPLALTTVEPVPDGEDRSGFAFFAVLLLYGQLIGIGIFVAMGVVEEKSSRVVELLLSTIKPTHLLAGNVIGLGLLGLGQLLVIAALGLAAAGLAGAIEIDSDLLVAAGLALAAVCSFLPPVAPMIMPARIAVGEANTVEIVGAFAVTLGAAALLIPLAARIYSGAVLRTGGAVKLRQAWRAARG